MNISTPFILGPDDELIIDNFAGGGGASEGIELALGRQVDIAINHDRLALKMHEANHRFTRHYPEDIRKIDPRTVTGGRRVGLIWFSPDCKHFSKAKGGQPRDKKIRGLAWVVLRWVNDVSPRVIILENVEEFEEWCPLLPDGKASAWRESWFFQCFVGALRRRGYAVEWNERRACEFGAPTIRKRLTLIARRDGRPIVWPAATHGEPSSSDVLTGRLLPYRTSASCMDFWRPCPSIFMNRRQARVYYRRTGIRIQRPLARSTKCRIAKGVVQQVINAAEPFVMPLTHEGPGRFYGMDDPLPTITAAHRGELALIAPMITEHANASKQRNFSANQPLRTQCAEVKGGHFALVTAFLAKHYTGVIGSRLTNPLGTVTTVDHHSLVTAHVMKMRGTNTGHGAGAPLHTLSAGGTHFAEVRAFLIKYYGNGVATSLRDPMHTVTTEDRFALVNVLGQPYAIFDIGMRMLVARELYRAQGFPESYIIGDDAAQGLALKSEDQVRMCGNSVCPPFARALVHANVPELAVRGWEVAA